ncbi:MAG: phosphoadenylyl-sulfate reductase [Gemmatimonadaceae bacterium]
MTDALATGRAADAEEMVRFLARAYSGRVALSASFGGGGLVLAHMISRIDASVPVLFLDTGLHFPETIAFKHSFAQRYGLRVVDLATPVGATPAGLYRTDPDRCCRTRKVEPMHRALADFDVWITGLRRDQSETRRAVDVIEHHVIGGRPIFKVMPLAYWTRQDVAEYLAANDVPLHPLLERGYTSIGCWPCTRPTVAGEGERAGRWSGTEKTECGLHAMDGR